MNLRTALLPLALFASPLVTGCAGVQFFDEKGKEIGFTYYEAKTYLVVSDGEHGKELSLLSLPDLSKERSVKQKRGWGTSTFGFDVQHGMLTKFNATSDSQTDELLSAIASLGTAQAGLLGAEAALLAVESEMDMTGAAAASPGSPQPYPIIKVRAALGALGKVISQIPATSGTALQTEKTRLQALEGSLRNHETITFDPAQPDYLNDLQKKLTEARQKVRPLIAEFKKVQANLKIIIDTTRVVDDKVVATNSRTALNAVVGELEAFAPPEPAKGPEIYEITKTANGTIELVRVKFITK